MDMRFLGNVIWFLFGGFVMCLAWLVLGLLLCITVVGIPFGIQCWKYARLNLSPFGKRVEPHFFAHPIMNVIWLILFGWEMAVGYLMSGILCCVTIIGIPFGLQAFKLMALSISPFGALVRKA